MTVDITDHDVEAYLARIGAARTDPPERLMAAHLHTVPFENLSVHRREPIRLAPRPLVDKIVRAGRGGFCYELNGAFALLLEGLGYEVTRVACRVAHPGGLTFPGDHMALVAAHAGRRLLLDVGFGRFAYGPVDLDDRGEQHDRFGVYTVAETADGDLDVSCDGALTYRVETRARGIEDFVPLAWWHATSPSSAFGQSLLCTLVTGTGRVTLAGDRLIETPDAGERTQRTLDVAEQLATYRDRFGIELDRVPEVLHPSAEGAAALG